MKKSAAPAPLNPSQIQMLVELLELRQLAPKETAARFDRLAQLGVFSPPQQDAIEVLFSLDDDEIPDALFDFADDEARSFVREGLPHEARLSYVAA
ncbi:hypothetical protein QTH87_24550 [Variovorax sp. J22P168]|uniref:hypothetical protein n=1 Tax=Variovorax jilinensis TaxID=3053513 RepID=UPI0025771BD5|nr:hypothetical protein [Variovorax sp. J22P168]MDM0015631.1 hypothetical protein [Variovorax sp. J22P168]